MHSCAVIRRLLAAQSREPHFVILEPFHQRFNFSQMAAARGIGAVEDPERGFLRGDRLFGGEIFQIQMPLALHAIAVRVGFREMVTGIEKQHRDLRLLRNHQVNQRHALGLKAGGDAHVSARLQRFCDKSVPVMDLALDRKICLARRDGAAVD